MTHPISISSPLGARHIVRNYAGFGILGADVPTTGENPSPWLNDGLAPDGEYSWKVVTPPSAGVLTLNRDGSFIYDATGVPDGVYPWTYRLFEFAVPQSPLGAVNITVGNPGNIDGTASGGTGTGVSTGTGGAAIGDGVASGGSGAGSGAGAGGEASGDSIATGGIGTGTGTGSGGGIGFELVSDPRYQVSILGRKFEVRLPGRKFTVRGGSMKKDRFENMEVTESQVLTFHFEDELSVGETLSGSPTVTISVLEGADARPADLQNGNAEVQGTDVLMPVKGQAAAVDYKIAVTMQTSNAKKVLTVIGKLYVE